MLITWNNIWRLLPFSWRRGRREDCNGRLHRANLSGENYAWWCHQISCQQTTANKCLEPWDEKHLSTHSSSTIEQLFQRISWPVGALGVVSSLPSRTRKSGLKSIHLSSMDFQTSPNTVILSVATVNHLKNIQHDWKTILKLSVRILFLKFSIKKYINRWLKYFRRHEVIYDERIAWTQTALQRLNTVLI